MPKKPNDSASPQAWPGEIPYYNNVNEDPDEMGDAGALTEEMIKKSEAEAIRLLEIRKEARFRNIGLRLPAEIWEKMDYASLQRGITMSQLLQECIERTLKIQFPERIRRRTRRWPSNRF